MLSAERVELAHHLDCSQKVYSFARVCLVFVLVCVLSCSALDNLNQEIYFFAQLLRAKASRRRHHDFLKKKYRVRNNAVSFKRVLDL